jgi:hypothetical protein
MTDCKRLELLVETVKYCQKVKKLGMPSSCYTKALREPVHYLWERRAGSKIKSAQFRSPAAKGLKFGKRELVYDHVVPFIILQGKLLSLKEVTQDSVRQVLENFGTICLITKAEDDRLNKAGLGRSMPTDEKDIWARYHAVGINPVENVVE